MVRGVYDLVFGYRDGDPRRPAVGAGVMTFLIGQVLFGYRGAIFWKMTAGMGDVVIAPLYQALRRRGVKFEFFHRLDALHLDSARQSIATITMARQARLAEGLQHYEPLTRIRGLPVFPKQPLTEQLRTTAGLDTTESHFGAHDDVEIRTLRRGVDFDHVVLAVSIGMVPIVAGELIEDRPEWRDMTTHVRTVATQAFQIWLHRTRSHSAATHPVRPSAATCRHSIPGPRCPRHYGPKIGRPQNIPVPSRTFAAVSTRPGPQRMTLYVTSRDTPTRCTPRPSDFSIVMSGCTFRKLSPKQASTGICSAA